VIKAFIANNFQFIDVTGQVITGLSDASIEHIDRVRITWHIKKIARIIRRYLFPATRPIQRFAPFLPHYVWCSEHIAFHNRIHCRWPAT